MNIEWKKIKRVALDEASEQEKQEVEAWKVEDDARRHLLGNAISYYQGEEGTGELTRENIKRAWKKVNKRGPGRRMVYRRILVFAAGAAVIAGLFFGVRLLMTDVLPLTPVTSMKEQSGAVRLILVDGSEHQMVAEKVECIEVPGFSVDTNGILRQLEGVEDSLAREIKYNEVIVPRCGEYRLSLADGTRVILNSESSIKFPASFNGKKREVYLSGEAYFDVARDEEKPFVIHADKLEVKVLGTEFNINAYLPSKGIYTTLVSGKVEVGGEDGKKEILLPNQQAEYADGKMSIREVDAAICTAWTKGRFYFKLTPLEEIAKQLQRWYDVEFFFTRDELKHEAFTGMIKKDYSVGEILEIIEKTTHVKFEIKERTIMVR